MSGSIGVLSCLDGYMNIALEQTEEHVSGAVTNRYGDAFIRGNNGELSALFVPSGVLLLLYTSPRVLTHCVACLLLYLPNLGFLTGN